MQLDVTLTEEDYIQFNLYHQKHLPTYKKSQNYYKISIVVILAAVLFALTIGGAKPSFIRWMAVYFIIISIIWILNASRYIEWRFVKYIRKLCSEGRAEYSKRAKLTFTDNSIVEESEGMNQEIEYSKISRLADNGACRYLYYSESRAFIVPDNSFDSDEAKLQLIKLLETKTGRKFE